MLFFIPVFSQENDSLWNFDDLEPLDDLENMEFQTGKGFFPGVPKGMFYVGFGFSGGNKYTITKGVSSEAFSATNYSYQEEAPEDYLEEFEISERWSDGREPFNVFRETAIVEANILLSSSLPFFWDFSLNYIYSSDYLISNLGGKPFLTKRNRIAYFNEYGIIDITEHFIGGSFGIKLPVYGAYIQSPVSSVANLTGNFYYLDFKYSPGFAFSSNFNQYDLIGTKKEDLRYSSGHDTLRYRHGSRTQKSNSIRHDLQIAFGSQNIFGPVIFETEITYRFPMTSVLKDSYWRQHSILISTRLRFKI